MRTERLHHLAQLRQIAVRERRTVLRLARRIVLLPVRIDETNRRLALHIHPEAVAIIQEMLGRRIMRGPDKVHVRTLEEQHIQAVQFSRRGSSQLRVNIMTAGAAQLHRHTVHKHLVFADLHLAETHPFAETADFLSVAHDLHVQGI